MPFSQFSSQKYVQVAESSGTTLQLGSVRFSAATELVYVRFNLFKHGTAGGSEVLTMHAYTDRDYTKSQASASVNLADITTDQYWIGWVRFDFDNDLFAADTDYYFGLETTSYTRNGDTYYLSAGFDWPVPANPSGHSIGSYLEFYERKGLDVR